MFAVTDACTYMHIPGIQEYLFWEWALISAGKNSLLTAWQYIENMDTSCYINFSVVVIICMQNNSNNNKNKQGMTPSVGAFVALLPKVCGIIWKCCCFLFSVIFINQFIGTCSLLKSRLLPNGIYSVLSYQASFMHKMSL